MGSRYEESSPTENLIHAINELTASLDFTHQAITLLMPQTLIAPQIHSFQGQLEAQHNDRASTGGPGNNDYAGAQIIYGCYCRTCSYWRGKLA